MIRHFGSNDTYADIKRVLAKEQPALQDGAALAIASWWQSPGAVGCDLAALATGARCWREEVLDDIAATLRAHENMGKDDRDALILLIDWVWENVNE